MPPSPDDADRTCSRTQRSLRGLKPWASREEQRTVYGARGQDNAFPLTLSRNVKDSAGNTRNKLCLWGAQSGSEDRGFERSRLIVLHK